jgi:hypothetical protein
MQSQDRCTPSLESRCLCRARCSSGFDLPCRLTAVFRVGCIVSRWSARSALRSGLRRLGQTRRSKSGYGQRCSIKITIPSWTYGHLLLSHEHYFPLVLTPESIILLGFAIIWLTSRKSHAGIVVYRVNRVGQHFFKRTEVHGVAVAVKEQDVVGINLTNRPLNVLVPDLESNVFGIGWLVHGIVSGDLGLLVNKRDFKGMSDGRTQALPA